MTKDYRGYTRSQVRRDPSSSDDKNHEGCVPRPPDGIQVCEAFGQEDPGKFFCLTRARDSLQPREHGGHPMLKAYFYKLSDWAITPCRATSGSVGYDIFTPIDFTLQPKEQETIFIDIAVCPPKGYQRMSKSGLTVLYELEVKAGVIDPDFTGNIGVVLKNNSNKPIEHVVGEQIAQLLFIKVSIPVLIQVQDLTKTQLGEHGFGAHSVN